MNLLPRNSSIVLTPRIRHKSFLLDFKLSPQTGKIYVSGIQNQVQNLFHSKLASVLIMPYISKAGNPRLIVFTLIQYLLFLLNIPVSFFLLTSLNLPNYFPYPKIPG